MSTVGTDNPTAVRTVRASVIIPTRNGGGRLPDLLEMLRRQQTEETWEVVVVEDGSLQIDPEIIARLPHARLARQKRGGPGSARNRGAALAQGELLVFLDDDCLPQTDWLREMVLPFADPCVVGVKGAYTTDQSGLVPRFVQVEYEEKFARLARKTYINFADGFSAAFRRRAFIEAEGFDERFPLPSVEDREFSLRLSRGHGHLVFNPRAIVRHRHVDTFGGYLAKKFKYGRWGFHILRRMPAGFVSDDHTPHTQRLQVGWIVLLPPTLIAAVFGHPWAVAVWAAVFWSSAVPLMLRAARRGWGVGLATIPLVFLRALGLAGGLTWGLLVHLSGRERLGAIAHRAARREGSAAAADRP